MNRYFIIILIMIFIGCSKENTEPEVLIPVSSSKERLKVVNNTYVDSLILDYMSTYDVPGLSLAVSKDSRQVYAMGYGYADEENRDTVNTAHLFRIASISKPVTSVAIMKLFEENKISLEDKIFGETGILDYDYGTQPYGEYIEDITVRHLLEHTAGGWSYRENVPMFLHLNYSHDQLISYTLDNIPLENAPGTKSLITRRHDGYCLALLMNTRVNEINFGLDLLRLLETLATVNINWTTENYFDMLNQISC